MNILIGAFVAYTVVFAFFWHNKPARHKGRTVSREGGNAKTQPDATSKPIEANRADSGTGSVGKPR
jgi:hypothetical protein